MYTLKELTAKSKTELSQICEKHHINRKDERGVILPKKDLILRIVGYDPDRDKGGPLTYYPDMSRVREKVVWDDSKVKDHTPEINAAKQGAMMAFFDETRKARTGALVNRSNKLRKVVLVTEYGREFIIPYENVLWVKLDEKEWWPKNVYYLLKGWAKVEKKTDKQ